MLPAVPSTLDQFSMGFNAERVVKQDLLASAPTYLAWDGPKLLFEGINGGGIPYLQYRHNMMAHMPLVGSLVEFAPVLAGTPKQLVAGATSPNMTCEDEGSSVSSRQINAYGALSRSRPRGQGSRPRTTSCSCRTRATTTRARWGRCRSGARPACSTRPWGREGRGGRTGTLGWGLGRRGCGGGRAFELWASSLRESSLQTCCTGAAKHECIDVPGQGLCNAYAALRGLCRGAAEDMLRAGNVSASEDLLTGIGTLLW